MMLHEFPDLRQNLIEQYDAKQLVKALVREVYETFGPKTELHITYVAGNQIVNEAPTPTETAKPKRSYTPSKTKKLNFRFLCGVDGLDLDGRIIYSYLWKWAWINSKRTKKNIPTKAVNVRRIRKATGLRPKTINDSLAALRSFGLIDERLQPFTKDRRYMGSYRKLRWEKNKLHIRFNVFVAMEETNPTRKSAGWYRMALGMPKRTYYRWKSVVTGGTKKVTGGTPNCNGWRSPQ